LDGTVNRVEEIGMKVVRGGRVLTHGRLEAGCGDIVIEGDAITALAAPGAVTSANAEVIDAAGSS